MRARKINEDIVHGWEEKQDPAWYNDEQYNFDAIASDFLEENGITHEQFENGEIDGSEIAYWVTSNWERFWDDECEMNAEQDFPGGVYALVDELNANWSSFQDSWNPGDIEGCEDMDECEECGEEYPEGEGYEGDDGTFRCEDCNDRYEEENEED